MKNGANNYLIKPVSHEELREAVDLLLPTSPVLPVPRRPDGFSGKLELNLKAGDWIRKMDPLLKRLAASDVPVLLQGETGVGKEVLARHIHNQSSRSGKTFLKLNCAALPPELVESELFGYERGAFTGAFKSTPGNSNWRTVERSCSMRSVTWISDSRLNYCRFSRIMSSIGSAQKNRRK